MNKEFTLSQTQVARANEAIMNLMKKRRFFLADARKDVMHQLNPDDFAACISFNNAVKYLYRSRQAQTIDLLRASEETLGLTPPDLREGQSMATCSLYTGGLEILSVYPLEQFLAHAPLNKLGLALDLFFLQYGDIDNIPPRQLAEKKEAVKGLTDLIWDEIVILREMSSGLVLIINARFAPTWESGFETLMQKTEGLQPCPLATAYLFYRHSCIQRLVDNDCVLFGGLKSSHPAMRHWHSEKDPSIEFTQCGGYDFTVKFVCVM